MARCLSWTHLTCYFLVIMILLSPTLARKHGSDRRVRTESVRGLVGTEQTLTESKPELVVTESVMIASLEGERKSIPVNEELDWDEEELENFNIDGAGEDFPIQQERVTTARRRMLGEK